MGQEFRIISSLWYLQNGSKNGKCLAEPNTWETFMISTGENGMIKKCKGMMIKHYLLFNTVPKRTTELSPTGFISKTQLSPPRESTLSRDCDSLAPIRTLDGGFKTEVGTQGCRTLFVILWAIKYNCMFELSLTRRGDERFSGFLLVE